MSEAMIAAGVLQGAGHVLLEDVAMQLVRAYRQDQPTTPEAGGVLLGFRRGNHLQITHATPPGQDDKRSRTSFCRAAASHQAAARKHWQMHDEEGDYVGEWHTHPEDVPAPSTIDLQEWSIVMKRNPGKPMIFLIVGRKEEWFGVGLNGLLKAFIPMALP
ncbi:Mov34/MPN/PAD-1 family protein [Stenotrophomonas maltophilia]|nr:Mov34/MPN/PAD-1 family protein [Stenotrophomonas maltophilia]MBH1762409.1 Mov34/MPN/PAD-1 family protein [Stenotrophomonas maltophilia]MBH1771135.1 Mov34/MPN/PAD-1 family protein [Stenotrophomonas maltophilia]HEL3850065.1 Mov34/MPN/PAD-1 family protein [Stenotrophomonas maltophilia]